MHSLISVSLDYIFQGMHNVLMLSYFRHDLYLLQYQLLLKCAIKEKFKYFSDILLHLMLSIDTKTMFVYRFIGHIMRNTSVC